MPTPTFLTGWEHGVISDQGGGLANAMSGTPLIETSIVKSGSYSLKIAPTGSGAINYRKNTSGGSVKIAVARVYFRIPTGGIPSSSTTLFGWQTTNSGSPIGLNITSAGLMRALVGSGSSVNGPTVSVDTWHMVDLRVNITGTTWTLDWTIDGISQTQAVWSGQLTTDALTYIRLGSASTTLTMTVYFDDLLMSETSGDYPLGAGETKLLVPNGQESSNAGTNVMEEADGTDCGVNSYQALNSIPMGDATNYIRQAANGNSNYIGVTLEDLSVGHSSVIGAMAILAYTSETTTSNKGGCIVSKDSFSSFTVIWGEQSATADYSDGSTSSAFFKTAVIPGVNTTSLANALAIRLGYSDDASPDPYWLDVAVEVAYVPSNDVTLDLVTYINTIRDVTILENIVIPLDLVPYTNDPKTLSILEHIPIPLDLVTYLNTIRDVTILENIAIPLDLVTYSNNITDVTILESIIIPLDLVTYTSSLNNLAILENIVILLDLASYENEIHDITILENIVIILDLITYQSQIHDIIIIEADVISMDSVGYLTTVHDLEILSSQEVGLDSVSYLTTFHDISILSNETILLDAINYSTVVPNLQILESIIIDLDFVPYTIVYHDIELVEADSGDVLLELVTYSTVIHNILLVIPVKTPIERVFAIERENRIFSIDKENRIV